MSRQIGVSPAIPASHHFHAYALLANTRNQSTKCSRGLGATGLGSFSVGFRKCDPESTPGRGGSVHASGSVVYCGPVFPTSTNSGRRSDFGTATRWNGEVRDWITIASGGGFWRRTSIRNRF